MVVTTTECPSAHHSPLDSRNFSVSPALSAEDSEMPSEVVLKPENNSFSSLSNPSLERSGDVSRSSRLSKQQQGEIELSFMCASDPKMQMIIFFRFISIIDCKFPLTAIYKFIFCSKFWQDLAPRLADKISSHSPYTLFHSCEFTKLRISISPSNRFWQSRVSRELGLLVPHLKGLTLGRVDFTGEGS